MEYYIFKMNFVTALHVGSRYLFDANMVLQADTLFSALCHEALKKGHSKLEELVKKAKNEEFVISDAMPFIEDEIYIPKPLIQIEDKNGDESSLKAFKKLKFISLTMFDEYMAGNLEPETELSILAELGVEDTRTNVGLREDSGPYHLGTYSFNDKSGLYVIVGYKGDISYVEDLFKSLGISGLGGKRSWGYGRFDYSVCKDENINRLLMGESEKYMTLSLSMARKEELPLALENARYLITKRSGFVYSSDYSDSPRKKKDLYAFVAGSCFENKFKGDIFDVSLGGRHAVYRYAKPMFMGVET